MWILKSDLRLGSGFLDFQTAEEKKNDWIL